jgi:hypothetical protein
MSSYCLRVNNTLSNKYTLLSVSKFSFNDIFKLSFSNDIVYKLNFNFGIEYKIPFVPSFNNVISLLISILSLLIILIEKLIYCNFIVYEIILGSLLQ